MLVPLVVSSAFTPLAALRVFTLFNGVSELSVLKGAMKWTCSIKKAPEFQRHPISLNEFGTAEVFTLIIEGNLFSERIEQVIFSGQTNGI